MFIYVASPYSHPLEFVRQQRYHEVMRYMVKLFKDNKPAYSPIMHWHHAAEYHNLPVDHEFWRLQDEVMLDSARHLHVLALPGWEDSRGVQSEIRRWRGLFGEPVIIEGPLYDVPDSTAQSLSRAKS
jgi:uncharacterized protein DUF1937